MTNKEFTRIKRELKPFQRLFLTVACLGLLSSCGGSGSGGSADTATTQDATKQIAAAPVGTVPAGWAGRKPVINTSGDMPFDQSKILPAGQSINTTIGVISNQYIVLPDSNEYGLVKDFISNLEEIRIVATREPALIVIEFNEKSLLSVSNLNALKEKFGGKIIQMPFGGKDVKRTHYVPDPGSNYSDEGENWHLEYIQMPSAWGLTYGMRQIGAVTGIVEAGYDKLHKSIFTSIDKLYPPIEASLEFRAHGNGVASTIAGAPAEGVSGINFNSMIQIGGYSGFVNHHSRVVEIVAAMALDKNVRVINISSGFTGSCKDGMCPTAATTISGTRFLRDLAERYKNILFVLSAGNDGTDARTQNGAVHLHFDSLGNSTVSRLSNVLVVGAINKDSQLVDYSDRGDLVDIAAPSGFKAASYYNILTRKDNYWNDESGTYGDGKRAFNGTSAAAPVVSGVASLISDKFNYSAEDIKSIILKSASYRKTIDGIPIIDAEAAVKEAMARKGRVTILSDDFNGSTIDSSKWSSLPCRSAGDPTFAGNGQVHFGPCQSASTQGKVTFSGKKIVIEARFAGPKRAGRDTAIALVNAATGDFFQFGDTDYLGRGIYAYLYYGGTNEFIRQYGGTTTGFKEYRVTIEGTNVIIQRGDSLSNLTETYTATLPRSATDGAYYLRIGTGTDWYAPADFDWIRVTTDATNPLNGHRYEVIDCGSWSQCQMAAVLRGGKLATIRSKAENDWIVSTLLPMSKNEWGLWIGYTNAGHEGRWTWDSGESASYTNWAPGEPNNSGGAEHYAHILNVASNPGSWNDLYENGFGYVSQAIIEYSK